MENGAKSHDTTRQGVPAPPYTLSTFLLSMKSSAFERLPKRLDGDATPCVFVKQHENFVSAGTAGLWGTLPFQSK